jgi:hypothetical protein
MLYSENTKKLKHEPYKLTENGDVVTATDASFRESVFVRKLRELLKPQTLRPLLLVLMFFFFQHCSGFTAMRPYMVKVFEEFGLPIDAHWVTVSVTKCLTNKLAISTATLVMASVRFGDRLRKPHSNSGRVISGGERHGFGPLANYADRATAACWRSSANFCRWRVLRGQRNGSPWSLVSVFLTGTATISSK